MRLSIQLHPDGLSLSDTVSIIERFGVDRARSTINNWVHKADLQPTTGRSPYRVAIDGTVIHLDNQCYWLYAVIDLETNVSLHLKLFSGRTTALITIFVQELAEDHDVDDVVFFVDGAPWLKAALYHFDLRFHHVTHGNRNAVERVFKEVIRMT